MFLKIKLKKKKYKFFIIPLSILILLISFILFSTFFKLKTFKTTIESRDITKIEKLVDKKKNFLSILLSSNFSSILNDELLSLENQYINKSLPEDKYLELLDSYKNLNLSTDNINKAINNLPLTKLSENKFQEGLNYFNKGDYEDALALFEEINENTPSYKKAEPYINKSFKELTESTFSQTDSLIAKTNYTEAITLLEESKTKIKNQDLKVIDEKITKIKNMRMDYLYEYSKKSIENNLNDATKLKPYFGKLTKDNVNDFDITSKTNRFIFTDIQKQKTYVFKGSNKNWTLEKEFLCSTGVDNKETLVGYFEVIVKAPWFFSPKYGQGGKNYVQFKGNYLYHSLPLAVDQSTVLDYTLGEPASHGCIRLELEDSKWLYDNIEAGTTVMIF